jgi:hypothetical protein
MRLSVLFAAGGTVGMICTSLFDTTTVNSYAIDGAFYGTLQMKNSAALTLPCACLSSLLQVALSA